MSVTQLQKSETYLGVVCDRERAAQLHLQIN